MSSVASNKVDIELIEALLCSMTEDEPHGVISNMSKERKLGILKMLMKYGN